MARRTLPTCHLNSWLESIWQKEQHIAEIMTKIKRLIEKHDL